jgi:hypothetical protein
VQSTGATVVVVVVVVVVGATVVVVVGTGAGVHAANNATHAATKTTRSEPCFRIGVSPTLRWPDEATRKE